jgi:hypothetical protein
MGCGEIKMGMHSNRSRALIAALLLFGASQAFGAFGFYRTVTVDHTKVPSTQTNFPILISVTNASLKTVGNGGNVQNSNGYDIRPYTDSALTTAITGYELERYNATTGEVVMWVNIASLSSSSDTIIYLAYGNGALTTDGSSSTTWDANYKVVYHLKDGTTLSLVDSTGGNNGTGSGTPTVGAGIIDGAMTLVAASSQSVAIGTATDIPVSTAWTASFWMKMTQVYAGGNDFAVMWGGSSNNGPHVGYKDTGFTTPQLFMAIWGGAEAKDPATISQNVWYHVAGVWDGTNITIYKNGTSVGTTATTIAAAAGYTGEVGTDNLGGGNNFDGLLDEVRFSSTNRSADWLTTEYNNGSNPGTFETLGSEVPVGGAGGTNRFFMLFFP